MRLLKIVIFFIILIFLTAIGCSKKNEHKSSGFIDVEGARLQYIIEGKGKNLLIPHDRLLMSRVISKNLRNHFRIIFVDTRCEVPHKNGFDVNKVTLKTLVDDVEHVRKILGLKRVIFFGHSIWGFLALEYSRQYPQNTSHVILNATPPGFPESIEEYMKKANEYWESYASDERKTILKQNWEKLPKDALSKLSKSDAEILTNITNGPMYWYDPKYDCSWLYEGAFWNPAYKLYEIIMSNYDIGSGEKINMPIFLSLGRHDYVVPYILWDTQKEKLPTLSYNLFERSGHFPMLEEQELFDKKLIEWIKNN